MDIRFKLCKTKKIVQRTRRYMELCANLSDETKRLIVHRMGVYVLCL